MDRETARPAWLRLKLRSLGWPLSIFVLGLALRLASILDFASHPLRRLPWVDEGAYWTRAQAIEFFFDNVGLTERETLNEVDRYIIWPGQALAYKVGQRAFEAARHEQQQRLGERFDLRAFHDALLAHAAVPLSTVHLLVDGLLTLDN